MNEPLSDPAANAPRPLSAIESRPSTRRVRLDLAIYLSAYALTLTALFLLIYLRG